MAAVEARPVAVITGASRGIGAATARLLAGRGYALVLAARSGDELRALAAELVHDHAVPAEVVLTDVTDRAALRHLAAVTLERFGRVDVLLNNAGVVHPGVLVAELTDAQVDTVLATNLTAAIDLTRALLPSMLAAGRGYIGFVDSVGGHLALPSASMYSATKFGMRGFGHALRREVASAGVHVCVICPGFVRTRLTDDVQRIFGRFRIPMGRPKSVAEAIVRSIDRPRAEIVMPFHNRFFIGLERNVPWVMDRVASLYLSRVLAASRRREAGP